MTGLRRIIRSGFINFKRSGIVSWAAVLVVTITLSVITAIILLQAVLYSSLDQIKEKVDVTIYFNVGASEDKILALKSSIEKLPEVAQVSYTSSEEALKAFRERHSNDYPTIQALDEIEDNPLGGYLNIKAKEVSQYETIANFMKSDNALTLGSASIIDKVNYHQNKLVIDRLGTIIAGAQRLGFVVTLILIIISIIITFNTIRLAIFISKEEIGVMRLVGASKTQVRGPFAIEGLIYGFISTLITLALFWPVTAWLGNNMTGFLGLNLYEYYTSNFLQISAIVLLSGIALGMFSSFLAIRKYLKR
ncbi:permease-like cell division protein FtsX [Patescibacteria group bacterium]|nr:permease-like cell division protein FtsX [Patescibacteria group bacterium]MBU1728000.1 permease-like cell division protein FtsX [Patescibacteria group bacterium]